MIIHQNVSLKPYNTFGLDENVAHLALVESVADLKEIFNAARFRPQRKMVLGGGSNVLFTRGWSGVIVRIGIKGISVLKEEKDSIYVSVGAGENWHQFVMWCVAHGYGGIENLSLIPGTVGAAPMQNIGAYGVELKEVFHSLEAYEIKSGKTVIFYKADCQFGYRTSVFKGELKDQFVITKVTFKLSKVPVFRLDYGEVKATLDRMGESPSLKAISQAVMHIRQSKLPDPSSLGNAGSFFKNPIIDRLHFEALEAEFADIRSYPAGAESVKVPAGWLIEKAGWKGRQIGECGVHEKQALVLVNLGGARGRDILHLSEQIQDAVQQMFGIELEREVNVI